MPSSRCGPLADVLRHPLVAVLRQPESAVRLSLREWRALISAAYLTNLMGTVAVLCHGLEVPPKVWRWLDGTEVQTRYGDRMFSLELEELSQLLAGIAIPAMLLKGGAYRALQLELAEGRVSVDIDVMVPRDRLRDAEDLLRARGWQDAEEGNTELDRQYFRQWLHELPPLVHPERLAVLDLHHNILPRTDRLCFEPQILWDAAETVASGIWVPCRGDLVLHACAHLFRNGRFHHGIRDLRDIHCLLAGFQGETRLWDHLLDRAEATGLRSSLALGLRYASALFETPVPAEIRCDTQRWLPPGAWVIDRLVGAALLPRRLDRIDQRRQISMSVLAHLPLPRFRAMSSRIFWTKRFARAEPQLTPG